MQSNARLFADDTALDRKIVTAEDAQTLQSDLDALAKWESEWDMTFHPDKCQVLHVDRSRTTRQTDYYLHGHKLKSVQSTKYLGVTLQTDGEFDLHISEVANNGNKMLGFIRRSLKINSKSTKELAYKMLVRPKMEYASTVWDPHTDKQKDELEKVQRRAARVVTNRHRYTSSVTDMLDDLKWETLEQRRKDARLILMYKVLKGDVSIVCQELKLSISRPRRGIAAHSKNLDRCTCGTSYRLNAFLPRTVRDWNALPEEVVTAACAKDFRQKLSELV